MASPEQFVPPGVDAGKVEEIRREKPQLRVIEGGKSDKAGEMRTPDSAIAEGGHNVIPGSTPAQGETVDWMKEHDERYAKQMKEDNEMKEQLQDAIENSTLDQDKWNPTEFTTEANPPSLDRVKQVPEGFNLPLPDSEKPTLRQTVEQNPIFNEKPINYGDMQSGMDELPELSSEFLKEDDVEELTAEDIIPEDQEKRA